MLKIPFKKYLLTGLLTWLPLAVTIWVLLWLFGVLEGVSDAVLIAVQAIFPFTETVLQRVHEIPGVGALVVVAVLFLTGALVSNVAGRWWVRLWDRLINRIPVVTSIYNGVKKVSQTLFSSNGQAFRKAVLIEFPRAGSWTIAFQTGTPSGEVASHFTQEFISVYVPTTPNPTGGYFLMMPRSQVIELNMSVDEALTYVISMGSAAPQTKT